MSEAGDALRFEGVCKRYPKQERPALDELSFRIPTGSISGFIGPNGAGKTTSFSVVSGFLAADAGVVSILGEPGFDPWRLKRRLGVLPQDAELPERHSALELLEHLGRLQGLSKQKARAEAERCVALVALGERARHRIGTLSHGMRRRVAVASALVGEPELVLLDEPTAGLDPMQTHSLRHALEALRGGPTLVVSSHNLDELEKLCDWVVMLDRGSLVRQGPLHEVTGRGLTAFWRLSAAAPLEQLRAAMPNTDWRSEGEYLVQEAPSVGDLDAGSLAAMRVLSDAGIAVQEMRRGASLERTFLETTRRETS